MNIANLLKSILSAFYRNTSARRQAAKMRLNCCGVALIQMAMLCLATDLRAAAPQVHCWEPYEIALKGTGKYQNIYRDVECWVTLKGPGFDKKVWGFWDGKDEQDPVASHNYTSAGQSSSVAEVFRNTRPGSV